MRRNSIFWRVSSVFPLVNVLHIQCILISIDARNVAKHRCWGSCYRTDRILPQPVFVHLAVSCALPRDNQVAATPTSNTIIAHLCLLLFSSYEINRLFFVHNDHISAKLLFPMITSASHGHSVPPPHVALFAATGSRYASLLQSRGGLRRDSVDEEMVDPLNASGCGLVCTRTGASAKPYRQQQHTGGHNEPPGYEESCFTEKPRSEPQ